MNSRLLLLALVAVVAALGGWFARSWKSPRSAATGEPADRRILYYQSAMHPWIKSDQPGKCTICGMDLAPVFEGEAGFAASPDLVTLSSNSITVAHVQTHPVTRGTLVRTLNLAGTVNDDATRRRVLSAFTDGRLDRLFVNYEGAEVQAGQPLALLYSPPLLTAIREYLALVRRDGSSEANAGLTPLKSAAALRLRQLGLLPGQIEQLPATFTETNLHVEILAPLSGTVVLRDVREGQTVTAGQRLFELADFSTMWLQLEAYESDLPWISPGQEVEITLATRPGEPLTQRITFIDPNFNPATRSTQVRVEIPNPLREDTAVPTRTISNRVFARGRIHSELANALKIPRSAVLDAGQPLVFVELSDGTYQPRRVTLGRRGDLEVEILSGVSEGERVVTQGALLLDAQAQLNSLTQAASQPSEPAPAPAPELSSDQKQVVREFLELADALRESLSADALPRFNELAPQIHAAAAILASALGETSVWNELSDNLVRVSHLDPAPDLPTARQEFHPLSVALVQLGQAVRVLPEFSGLKVYECPMTRRAFPGAPARAGWLQLTGPLRNPYFGAEMLDCGTEVRP